MTVDVNGVRFVGLEFRATGASVTDMISLAATTAITGGVTFEDCVFNGADQTGANSLNGVAGIRSGPTNAVTGLVVRRCVFRDLGQTPLELGVAGAPYAKIEDNLFAIDTNLGWGIAIKDTAAFGTGKGYVIRNNEFIGPDAISTSQVGIRLFGTVNATAGGLIRSNYFAYTLDAAITQDIMPSSIIENYVAGNDGSDVVDGSST